MGLLVATLELLELLLVGSPHEHHDEDYYAGYDQQHHEHDRHEDADGHPQDRTRVRERLVCLGQIGVIFHRHDALVVVGAVIRVIPDPHVFVVLDVGFSIRLLAGIVVVIIEGDGTGVPVHLVSRALVYGKLPT